MYPLSTTECAVRVFLLHSINVEEYVHSNTLILLWVCAIFYMALIVRSLPGLVAAGFLQAAILTFHFLIEKPHFQRLHRSS